MANIDVSDLLLDPDFVSTVTLIRRSATVDGHGENVLTETIVPNVLMSVQGAKEESLARMPEGARLTDIITVFYRGQLTAEAENGYGDVIVWNGKRYQVKVVPQNFMNFGAGFTVADCLLEPASV